MRTTIFIFSMLISVSCSPLTAQHTLPESIPSPSSDTIVSYVKSPVNELRKGPKGTSDKIASIPQYETVLIVGPTTNNYCKVIYKGKTGYVYKTHLDLPDLKAPAIEQSLIHSPGQPKENQRTYFMGPLGGCYYINSNGNKEYDNRENCKE